MDALTSHDAHSIYDAWTNEPWVVDGAAVRVSVVCACTRAQREFTATSAYLNGGPVDTINPDLTSGVDVTKARKLKENSDVAFQGVKLTGPFDIGGTEARALLRRPINPNGKPNSDVIRRLFDIDDVVGRDSDRWVVDFGTSLSESAAKLYEGPFEIVSKRVVPFRDDPEKCRSTEKRLRDKYWEFQRPRTELRKALQGKSRVILTPESSEHRVFTLASSSVLVQESLFCIVRSEDEIFGILSSRIHEVWSTAQGNKLGAGNQRRYNIGVTFEKFPFPEGLTLNLSAADFATSPKGPAIASAARELYDLRERWLNPSDLVKTEAEVAAGFPDRVLALDDAAALELKKRTLINLYNLRPAWLADVHAKLDKAVADAYGWTRDLSDDEILSRLLSLNLKRAKAT